MSSISVAASLALHVLDTNCLSSEYGSSFISKRFVESMAFDKVVGKEDKKITSIHLKNRLVLPVDLNS